jgi:hypothetical protein
MKIAKDYSANSAAAAIAAMLLLAAVMGCAPTRAVVASDDKPPPRPSPWAQQGTKREVSEVEWILVEEDPLRASVRPDGADYIPGARILVQRPAPVTTLPKPPKPPAENLTVKIDLVSQSSSAVVGDEVLADIHVVNAIPEARYEILIEPTRESVRMAAGSDPTWQRELRIHVRGGKKVRVKFTSLADGTAGIRVTCRRVLSNELGKNLSDVRAALMPR